MRRVVQPELLDSLPTSDPHAIRSRADLRRLNVILGHARIMARQLRLRFVETSERLRLVDLGAGDGTFLLRLAQDVAALRRTVHGTLLDRQALVSPATRHAFKRLHWSIESVPQDVMDWLAQPFPTADMMIANLFLHHLPETSLAELLRLVSARTNFFIACEPRRSPFALMFARGLGLIGCNHVTRNDAVLSVRAGFMSRELSALWPADGQWQLSEQPAGLFSHCFIARRNG